MRLLICALLFAGCVPSPLGPYIGRNPIGAPSYQYEAAYAPEWDWSPNTRHFGAHLYMVVIPREEMLRQTGGISAYGLSKMQEPFVYFVREDVLNNPALLCIVVLHESAHLMSLWEYGSMDGGHCRDGVFETLKRIQTRICGEREFEENQPKHDCS